MLARTWFISGALSLMALAPAAGENTHSVDELSWIAGHWRGEGLGGECEEIWSAPSAGTMMGTFRLMKDGDIVFYEFMVLTREADGIVMKLKHFTPELSGWEEKDDMVRFPLESLEPNRASFEGLTMVRTGDELEVVVVLHGDDGSVREEPFRFHRYDP
jgi:hypothetical protein